MQTSIIIHNLILSLNTVNINLNSTHCDIFYELPILVQPTKLQILSQIHAQKTI